MKRNNHIILWVGVFALLVLTLLCGFRILKNSAQTYDPKHPDLAQYASDLGKWQEGIKSLPRVPNDSVSIDSVINIMRSNQILLLAREDELINDFRQEMNNNINKTNTWLAYAIGVMSMVGVIIPLFIQYNNNRNYDSKIQSMSADFDYMKKTGQTLQDEMRESINEMPMHLNTISSVLHVDIDNAISSLSNTIDENIELSRLLTNFLSFSVGIEDRLLAAQPNRDTLLRYMWIRLTDSIHNLVNVSLHAMIDADENYNNINNSINYEHHRNQMMVCFIILSSSLTRLRNGIADIRNRDFDIIYDNIRHLMVELEYGNNNTHAWRIIGDHIEEVMTDLATIRIPE